jgi:hypothetical protein
MTDFLNQVSFVLAPAKFVIVTILIYVGSWKFARWLTKDRT